MLGVLRLLLALLVLFSHIALVSRTPSTVFNFNVGVASVICFYFISGYLMRHSYRRFLAHSASPVRDFYKDRVLKLFPQYLCVVAFSFICIGVLGHSEYNWILNQEIGVTKVVLNLLLLPANYVFEPWVIPSMMPHPIVPPAWSLSTEFHFYMLLPLIFVLKRWQWLMLLALVLTVQLGSLFVTSSAFNANSFLYRYIYGVLTIFLFGFAYAGFHDKQDRQVVFMLWGIFLSFLLLLLPAFDLAKNTLAREVLVGACLAFPLLHVTLRLRVDSGAIRRADRYLGDLAYPVFITHFIAFYLAEKLLPVTPGLNAAFLLTAGALCIFMSIMLSSMQRRIENYRISTRGFASLKNSNIAAE